MSSFFFLNMDEALNLNNENNEISLGLNENILQDKGSFEDNSEQQSFREGNLLNDEESVNVFPFSYPLQNDEDIKNFLLVNPKEEEKVKENVNNDMSSTKPCSDQKGENKISKLKFKNYKDDSSQNLPSYFRLDMAKKHFKVQISQFGTEELNNLIKKSTLPSELKQSVHLPNSKKFTSKVKDAFNYDCLSLSLREIFIKGKENLQIQNEEYFDKIFEYFEKIGEENLPKSLKEIKEFLEMKYEKLIMKFYDSSEFESFKDNKRTKFFNDNIRAEKGFSILENYGLIRLFKMVGRKRKRD